MNSPQGLVFRPGGGLRARHLSLWPLGKPLRRGDGGGTGGERGGLCDHRKHGRFGGRRWCGGVGLGHLGLLVFGYVGRQAFCFFLDSGGGWVCIVQFPLVFVGGLLGLVDCLIATMKQEPVALTAPS